MQLDLLGVVVGLERAVVVGKLGKRVHVHHGTSSRLGRHVLVVTSWSSRLGHHVLVVTSGIIDHLHAFPMRRVFTRTTHGYRVHLGALQCWMRARLRPWRR